MSGQDRPARWDTHDGDEAPRPALLRPHVVEPWPAGISRTPTMRISDVLGVLQPEFPAVSHSKLRFLEDQGLVEPRRTPAGYRQYSLADVERLRFVLGEQRDRYLPLKVIKDKLATLDAAPQTQSPTPRPVADAPAGLRAADRVTVETLAADSGLDVGVVADLVAAGIITPDSRGHYDAWTRTVVDLVATLAEHGIEARHLRALRTAVDRELSLIEQVVAPVRGKSAPSARARAAAQSVELGETFAQLHTALLRQGIADR